MHEWQFSELTGGIWTRRYDKNSRKIYEGDRVKTPSGIGHVRYNPKYWRFEVAYEGEPLENERIPDGVPEECWEVIDAKHWICPVGEKGKKRPDGANMNNSLFKYDNGLEIFNITGRGVVIFFPYSSKEDNGIQPSFKQHVGDKWMFEFNNTDLSNKIVEVKGIEIANSFIQPYSPYGLCFGGQFNENEKKLMKLGKVSFHKIENNVENLKKISF